MANGWEAVDAFDVHSGEIQTVLDAVPDGWAKIDGEWVETCDIELDTEGCLRFGTIKPLRDTLHEEQKCLWSDFANAVRFAQVGKLDPEGDRHVHWSSQMTDLADRILNIAQLVGPTRWEDVQTGPLAGGWYKAVYGQAGIDYPEPDWDRVAEVQRAERGE